MRIYVLPQSFQGQETVHLSKKDAHYLTRVLRMQLGDTFPGRDRSGRTWKLTLSEISAKEVILTCSPDHSTTHSRDNPGGPEIHLFQSVCKGRKMDQILRQATEIGVHSITPVISRYTVKQGGSDRRRRWEIIITEALQQSGSPVITKLNESISLEKAANLAEKKRYFSLFFHQSPLSENGIVSRAEEYRSRAAAPPAALFIGPEGGFSTEEAESMMRSGMKPVCLETNILRAETAAVYGLALIQTLFRKGQRSPTAVSE